MLVKRQVAQTVSHHHKLEPPIPHHGKKYNLGLWQRKKKHQLGELHQISLQMKYIAA